MTNAVIRVGDGRGFIVNDEGEARLGRDKRIVITAAHCLPFVPPCDAYSVDECRAYEELLGPLGQELTVPWVECLFVDPIGDIAVLGYPKLAVNNMFAPLDGNTPTAYNIAMSIGDHFSRIFENPYDTPKIEGVELNFELVPDRRTARLENTAVAHGPRGRADGRAARRHAEVLLTRAQRCGQAHGVGSDPLVKRPSTCSASGCHGISYTQSRGI